MLFCAGVDTAASPVTSVLSTTVHVYVVELGTMFEPLRATVNADSLHAVAVCATIDGLGLTVTVTVKSAPVQLPDVGVTV
jgi:hypothetical protein